MSIVVCYILLLILRAAVGFSIEGNSGLEIFASTSITYNGFSCWANILEKLHVFVLLALQHRKWTNFVKNN